MNRKHVLSWATYRAAVAIPNDRASPFLGKVCKHVPAIQFLRKGMLDILIFIRCKLGIEGLD